MARVGFHDITEILQAAESWRDRCLLKDGSMFSDVSLWHLKNLNELDKYFIQNYLDDKRTFYEKLKIQLEPAPSDLYKLAAEMLWVYMLFPSKITSNKKSADIIMVWDCSGDKLHPQNKYLLAPLEKGIGHTGAAYNTGRFYELSFFIQAMEDWKSKPEDKQQSLIADPWKFGDWLYGLKGAEKRQLRHILVYLLFPDYFERIASRDHKGKIVDAFHDEIIEDKPFESGDLTLSESLKIDWQLYEIRKSLESKHPGDKLDFYKFPLEEKWLKKIKIIQVDKKIASEINLLIKKKQIIFYGPPGTGKTFNTKVVALSLLKN